MSNFVLLTLGINLTRVTGCVLPPIVLLEISRLLNTGLDMESLSICVRLCEQGINPEALSAVIKELRKASESLKVQKLPPKELTFSYF